MNTKKRLNCYVFSNLIISVLSLNLALDNSTTNLVSISNGTDNVLNKIYEKESSVVIEQQPVINENLVVVSNKPVQSKNTITYIKPSYNSVTGSALVEYSKHYLGLRYVSGGNSLTTGTDCSGFTKLIFKEFGINLGRTVNSQIYQGKYVSKADLRPGDLVFYGSSSSYASHVGIYMGSGLVIHESNPRDGVKINSVDMMVYITARRLITENVVIKDDTKEENPEVKEEIKDKDILDKEENEDNNINNEVDSNKKEEVEELSKEDVKDNVDSGVKEENKIEEEIKENIKEEVPNVNNNSSADNKVNETVGVLDNSKKEDETSTNDETLSNNIE